MALLTVQTLDQDGLETTYAACTGGGDTVPVTSGSRGRKLFLHVKNGHSAPQTVTVGSAKPCDQGGDHDLVVPVTNAEERMIGPLPADRFDNGTGVAAITYSGVTALTIAAIEIA